MHYKNGREAKEGDAVVWREKYPVEHVEVGVIHDLVPSNTTCNCQVSKIVPGAVVPNNCKTVSDLYHAEDALSAIENLSPKPQTSV